MTLPRRVQKMHACFGVWTRLRRFFVILGLGVVGAGFRSVVE